ncbi:MAG TPA: cellulose synthase subunit BcsC-related outer membrane protein [Acidobacteriaceae bacterium]|jgi:tetratricopeptide (TPR) repeat protein|nr:cellulose synthase subunit BcsC-related outer membrane protein [Acidobacteriaceae bacterium]
MEGQRLKRILRCVCSAAALAVALLAGLPARGQSAAETALLDKAQTLEQSGHEDLAAQTWQQVLLSDPNNQEALAGLGRWAKLSGHDEEAEKYVERLRAVNPNNPEIPKIEALVSHKAQNERLQQAAELAKNGHNEAALRIYREIFDGHPPDNWALAYYDTEAAIPATREDAIAGLRSLAQRYPGMPQYTIDLGRVLTYDAKTRLEGEHLLSQYPHDATAQAVLRQALTWDVQNPAMVAEIRGYLKTHPDVELERELAATEARQAQLGAGLARTPGEQAAYRALAAGHLSEAQDRFAVLSAQEPKNPRVMAGLGFLRMKQGNFGAAAQFFEQAEENGLKVPVVRESLESARFWNAMQQGTMALNANRLDDAVKAYQAALAMRPRSVDAQTGLAGAYMKGQEPAQAVSLYQQLLRREPRSAALWRGLFMAEAQAGQAKAAIATAQKFPVALGRQARKDPIYLRTLSTVYGDLGDGAEAERLLVEAINLPYAPGQEKVRTDTLLQYAQTLGQNRHYGQAAAVYEGMLARDPENVSAWQGRVSLLHQMGRDPEAITMVERMPPTAYDEALSDPNFLAMLAGIYQEQSHPEVAQGFLERAVEIDEAASEPLPIGLQLQVAGLDLERNHADAAYRIYRSVLMDHPERLDGWKGLLAALHKTGHDADALAQLGQIPPEAKRQLDPDVEFEQTEASIYAANGDVRAALGLVTHVEEVYRSQGKNPPARVDIQNAWLLLNVRDDRDLYQQLMLLGGRPGMTDDERREVQTIWASWAQQRAAQAAAAGDHRRALEILTAAARAFPGNPEVSKSLAVGYLQANQPRDALAIFESLDPTNATAGDYQSMVGAAIASQNMKLAETWVRQGLEKFPNDPKVLAAAANFELARGDRARAAEYWRASLKAMPPVSPQTELAHKLDHADLVQQTKPAHGSDLVSLLNPDTGVEAPQQKGLIPLPSYQHPETQANNAPYGPDPYYTGTAPVPMPPSAMAPSEAGTLPQGPTATPQAETSGTANGEAGNPPRRKRLTGPQPPRTQPQHPPYRPQASLEMPEPTPEQQAAMDAAAERARGTAAGGPIKIGGTLDSWVNAPGGVSGQGSWSDHASDSNDHVHLAISSSDHDAIPLQAQTTQARISTEPPELLGLDYSQDLIDVAARARSRAALAEAEKSIDPALMPVQNPEPRQQIALQPAAQYEVRPPEYFEPPPEVATNQGPGASDDELMNENLPPLRGSYPRPAVVRQRDLRQQAEMELSKIEGGYSPWYGGTGFVNHRSGTAGFDSLTALHAPFEASGMLGGTVARLTVISDPTFLDSGAAILSPTLPGGVVERLGTAPKNAVLNQQNAAGIGGEVQLATPNFAVSAGYSPYGFVVSNVIGRGRWKPANGPFTFTFERDSVKDSQLAYAGLHDPGSAGPGYEGNVWGGVVATGGEAQFAHTDGDSGFYGSAGGQYLDGVHVQANSRIDGDAGAYWQVRSVPDEGAMTVGVNFFGMHYAHNSTYFTYGQGGYFSPQAYFLASVPMTLQVEQGWNLRYTVTGSFGVQAFQQDSVPYFPLDTALEVANNNPSYSAQTVVSGNYDLKAEAAYHLSDHWYAGGFADLNNTRDYNDQVVGFYVRFLIRPQVPSDVGPTGLYPWDGLRPYQAP